MRRFVLVAVVVAFLIFPALPPGGVALAAAGSITGFFYDGWAGLTFPAGNGAIGSDGSVTGEMDRPTHLYVEAIGPDGDHWELSLDARQDAPPLSPGTYVASQDVSFIISHAGENGCGGTPSLGSITISELEVDGAGVVTNLAADFDYKCTATSLQPVYAHGQVRINSTVPLTSIGASPQHLPVPWTDHDFGVVHVNAQSAPWPVMVTNYGTTSVDVAGSMAGDPTFSIEPGGCSGALAPGESCALSVVFQPTGGGGASAQLHVLTPSLWVTDRVYTLAATGFIETTTTLAVDPLDDGVTPGSAAYRVVISPANAEGYLELTRTCGDARFTSFGGTWNLWTPAGPCTATATFTGGAGFGSSSSGPVDFVMPAKSDVLVDVVAGTGWEGYPLTVSASLSGANGVDPTSGSLTLTDETTGLELASGTVGPGAMSIEAVMDQPAVGDHLLRAVYSGDGVVLGTTSTRIVTILDDNYPPDGQLVVPEFTPDAVITAQTPAMDLPIDVVTHVALSNDGVHWATYPYAPTVEWSLIDPLTGGSDVDGLHTVYAKWRDPAGNWTLPISKGARLDRGAPVGSVVVDDGASYATSAQVTLAIPATDAVSGVSAVAISNNGTAWSTKSYASQIAWTLPAGSGTRTVWVKWRDKAGNWSLVKTDAIVLDTALPTTTSPVAAIATGAAAGNRPSVNATWAGSDAMSGIKRYEMAMSVDGGPWATLATTLTAGSRTQALAAGHRYRLRARAVDKAGNVGTWATGPVLTLQATPDTGGAITYSTGWKTVSGTSLAGASAHATSIVGASATYSFTGRSVAWMGSLGPSYGKTAVYLDGVRIATVDQFSATRATQRVVFSHVWSSIDRHTLRLVSLATPGRPTIDVDGFYAFTGLVTGAVSTGR